MFEALSDAPAQPTLLYLVGPPAVGKMAVGAEIARRTGLRLFHNHLTIEPVLPFFEFGTPPFMRLVGEFRRRLFEEVAGSDLPGLTFTYVWAFEDPSEQVRLEDLASPFRARGGRVLYAELEATLEERLRRNETEFRLAEKPSKRNVEESKRRLLELDSKHQFNSGGVFDGRADYLRIENTHVSAGAAAEQVISHFGLRLLEESLG